MVRMTGQFVFRNGRDVAPEFEIDVDIDWREGWFAPVDEVADWNGCNNCASVWNGWEWVSCEGPGAPMANRCPDCDFRS